ncbi:MAG: acetate kinase [Clostridiales bacterium]|nr:acetate kinase [Clostridiales bacterium]
MKVLVINAGSSSVKYQLIDMEKKTVLAKGLCERIAIDGHLKHTPLVEGKVVFDEDIPMPTHSEAIAAVIDKLVDPECGVLSSMSEIDAVGHRVVHGGEAFAESMLIDEKVMAALEECIPLAPLHNPANITGINACKAVMGESVPQVAVFDTSFHQTMPNKAYVYALPYEYYTKHRVRRYGFHGISHRYISGRLAELMGRKPEELKLISCHMGNGSSITAVMNGKSVDTSMGFTPLAGVPMGTRCGDIDTSIVEYISERENISVQELSTVLNKKSGVFGISGVSSDFRDLEDAANNGNERARLALDMFYYSVAKYIGAYTAAMNGTDAIVFTAGIGENSATTRKGIMEYLGYLGVEIDEEANSKRGEDIMISTEDSKVKVFVIPTNEELLIAKDTAEIVSK